MAEQNPLNRAWHVRTVADNNFLGGFEDEDAANARADQANKDAEQMGIVTRYKVAPRP